MKTAISQFDAGKWANREQKLEFSLRVLIFLKKTYGCLTSLINIFPFKTVFFFKKQKTIRPKKGFPMFILKDAQNILLRTKAKYIHKAQNTQNSVQNMIPLS